VVSLYRGFTTGPSGLFVLLVSWGFGLLQIAILVRVIASWLPVSPFSPWLRWSFTLSEPLLRPLRRFIPLIGSIDITPIVAFFLISIVQSIVVGAIR
jgi:YggT family protein